MSLRLISMRKGFNCPMRRMRRNQPYFTTGKLNWDKLQLWPQTRGVLMNIHPQTVTCQQGPKTIFGTILMCPLPWEITEHLLPEWRGGWKSSFSSARFPFMCTCPARRHEGESQKILLPAPIWPIYIKPQNVPTHARTSLLFKPI